MCHAIGALLSEDRKIAVASSLITFIVSSVLFFTFGYFCHHCQQKPKQKSPIPDPVRSTIPVYANVTLEQDTAEQDLEQKENVAYGPSLGLSNFQDYDIVQNAPCIHAC